MQVLLSYGIMLKLNSAIFKKNVSMECVLPANKILFLFTLHKTTSIPFAAFSALLPLGMALDVG